MKTGIPVCIVRPGGIEPPTLCLKGRCFIENVNEFCCLKPAGVTLGFLIMGK